MRGLTRIGRLVRKGQEAKYDEQLRAQARVKKGMQKGLPERGKRDLQAATNYTPSATIGQYIQPT